jgi:hypothetical protein
VVPNSCTTTAATAVDVAKAAPLKTDFNQPRRADRCTAVTVGPASSTSHAGATVAKPMTTQASPQVNEYWCAPKRTCSSARSDSGSSSATSSSCHISGGSAPRRLSAAPVIASTAVSSTSTTTTCSRPVMGRRCQRACRPALLLPAGDVTGQPASETGVPDAPANRSSSLLLTFGVGSLFSPLTVFQYGGRSP